MRRALAAAVLAAVVCSPSATLAAQHHPAPTRAHATAALAKVKRLSQGKGVRTGFELSPALAQLAGSLPALSADDRREAEAILARPDDGQSDPPNTHKWDPAAVRATPYCTAHFCIHWVTTTSDAPDLTNSNANPAPDYVEQMAGILENEVYPCENGTAPDACAGAPGLGWRDPASDFGIGGGDQVDVYVENLYDTERVFGYVATDPGQDQNPAVPHYAYMVLDKDYSRFAGGSASGGLADERVTAAHEYNHVLQNAYDYLEDSWMFECTAVYMEDKVYPDVNDYLHYVPAFTANTKQPLTTFSSLNLKPYGSAVWNHWLDHRYGPSAVRSAWEQSVGSADFAPGAYSAAIGAAGGAGFSDEFGRFAAAAAEWDVPGSGFPDPYPDVPRDGILPVESQTSPFALPHTTFAFFDVPIPSGDAPVIRLTATLPAGTAGAVALVGREGGDTAGGTVTSNLTEMPSGGAGAVQLNSPSAFGRITAVVVNSDPSKSGFDQAADDYIFTKDAPGVVASVMAPGAPRPVTGQAALISDHGAFVNAGVDPHLLDSTWLIEYGRTSSYGSTTKPQKLAAATVGQGNVVAPLQKLKARTTYHFRVVASNSAGVAAGADMTFRTLRDVTKPAVTLKLKKQKLRTARARGLAYGARCSERCRGRAEIRISRALAREAGLPVVLAKTRVDLDARSRLTTLRVRLGARAKRVLGARNRALQVILRVNVVDDSRNRRIVVRRTMLSR